MSVPTYENAIGQATATTGTGTLTLGAALAGMLALGAAQDGKLIDATIKDVNGATETFREGLYTHAGTTLTRGTFESSSTGSALNLSGSAEVFITQTAERTRRMIQGYLEHATGPDADTTLAVGTMYVVDMSAWATADRTYTLPATAAVGDRIGVAVSSGNATYELILKPNTGDTINAGSAAAEWSRLFISGETVVFRCVTADSAWVVETDGRIPSYGVLMLSADCDGETAATFTLPTSASVPGTWTENSSRGMTVDTSTGKLTPRRAGVFDLSAAGRAKDAVTDQQYLQVAIYKSGAILEDTTTISSGSNTIRSQCAAPAYGVSVGDYFQLYYRTQAGSLGLRGTNTYLTNLVVKEVL